MAKVVDNLWGLEVNKPIVELLNARMPDIQSLDRTDLLRFARFIGWSFQDSFSADWNTNPKAEKFVRNFIESWSEFCRNGKNTANFVPYMAYLLDLPLQIHVMWAKATETPYDGAPDDPFGLSGTYDVAQGQINPTLSTVSYGTLVRFSDLDGYEPGWQSILDDPVNGWYPTSHVELEYLYADIPAASLPDTLAEETVAALFYTIAPIQLVLKSVSVRYDIETSIFISSGAFTEIDYM
jgi:hypothetical protein